MESFQEEIGIIPFHQYGNDFGLIDFMAESNFDDQLFIDLIRGENEQITEPVLNFSSQGYDQNSTGAVCTVDGQFFAPPPLELLDFDVAAATSHAAHDIPDFTLLNACENQADEEEIIMDGDESSGSGTTSTQMKKSNNKADRSKTLISERKRRGRMKEKLYALRSLVPNISKMDRASIVGDAVSYVQDLQMQAKKLKDEIAYLESSLTGGNKYIDKTTNAKGTNPTSFNPIVKKIIKMDVCQIEERGFYVRVVSNKGKGVAMFLYRALESLTSFNVQTSNLAASAENYVLTFTLHIMGGEMDVNLENMKLWIVSVFLNQGFEFQTSQSA